MSRRMKRRLLNRINFQQNTSQKKKKNSFVFSSMFVQFVVGITLKMFAPKCVRNDSWNRISTFLDKIISSFLHGNLNLFEDILFAQVCCKNAKNVVTSVCYPITSNGYTTLFLKNVSMKLEKVRVLNLIKNLWIIYVIMVILANNNEKSFD
jgi:hypothetical protein